VTGTELLTLIAVAFAFSFAGAVLGSYIEDWVRRKIANW